MSRTVALASASLVAAAICTFAQAPPPAFRATTRLVEVSVIVQDRSGAPVGDLTREDFEVYDEGQRQDVAALRVERTDLPADGGGVRPLPANFFSNLPSHQGSAANAVTVVLMDGLNTARADQARARVELLKFLGRLTPSDRVALYALGRDLRVVHDFTDDPAALFRALRRRGIYNGAELPLATPEAADTGDTELDAFLDQSNQLAADFVNVNRVRTTLAAIEAIAGHLSGVPGRKSLVWVSGGFPFSINMDDLSDGTRDRRTFSSELEDAARAVSAAQLAIYPVDARGVIIRPDLGPSDGRRANTRAPSPRGFGPDMAVQQSQDAMQLLAERTGGRAFFSANDLDGAIRRAIDDGRVTYVLAYSPTHNAWNGKFREIKMKVRRPGVTVRHRLGYFAFADLAQSDQARAAALSDAASRDIDATAIGMMAELAPDLPKPGWVRMRLMIQPGQITMQQQGERWVGRFDVLFALQATPGTPATITTQTFDVSLPESAYQQTLRAGWPAEKDFEAAKVGYLVKVVVRDATTGKVGSLTMRADRLK